MPPALHILGIRHHGPGSARLVARALETVRPTAVLIEGPADGIEAIALAAEAAMRPPVALLVYEQGQPRNAAIYPFAEFSPEWQAIRWSLTAGAAVRFIDLPRSASPPPADDAADQDDQATDSPDAQPSSSPASGTPQTDQPPPRRGALDLLAHAAGHDDGEHWWGRLIEELRGDTDPLAVFAAVNAAMAEARTASAPTPLDPDETLREAHMRRAIRETLKEDHQTVAVVCGAWHAPVLGHDALKSTPATADNQLLKGLPKAKSVATWIPWTYQRLAAESGYGAGIHSPGWYHHLWATRAHVCESWLTKVARLLRTEGLDAPPAGVIEAVRLAEGLAALRGRTLAGLDELEEATLSILCHANPVPLRIIRDKLIISDRLGEVPTNAPAVPLQQDLAALQKSLRLKPAADESPLDLDQRKPLDLSRSHLLHRLNLLNIPWGVMVEDRRRQTSTFHELWQLQWKPEFAVDLIDAARWGNTVQEAAANRVIDRSRSAASLPDLTSLLSEVLLADLPEATDEVLHRIESLAAVSADVARLLEAIPPLAQVLRYGNVRQTRSQAVEPMLLSLLARACAGLVPACASLDDDAAEAMASSIAAAHSALMTLEHPGMAADWLTSLRSLGETDTHGRVTGQAWRLLLESDQANADAAATHLSLALSPGGGPERAAAWLEGFLGGSGLVLVHDERLLGIVDQWLSGLPRDTFDRLCPIVRRTFSTFEKAERRKIGERIKLSQTDSKGPAAGPPADADYEPERGRLVEPIISLLLAEDRP